MKLYLAGPMRNLPEFNYPAFHAAAKMLRAQGHVVFNPAEEDIGRTGVDVSKGNEHGSLKQAEADHGFSLRDALMSDLMWICAHAEGIAMLPGWFASKGATAEHALAVALDLEVIYL